MCFSPAGSTSGKAVDATELTAAPSPIFDLLGDESAFSPTEKDIGYLQKSAKTIITSKMNFANNQLTNLGIQKSATQKV